MLDPILEVAGPQVGIPLRALLSQSWEAKGLETARAPWKIKAFGTQLLPHVGSASSCAVL